MPGKATRRKNVSPAFAKRVARTYHRSRPDGQRNPLARRPYASDTDVVSIGLPYLAAVRQQV